MQIGRVNVFRAIASTPHKIVEISNKFQLSWAIENFSVTQFLAAAVRLLKAKQKVGKLFKHQFLPLSDSCGYHQPLRLSKDWTRRLFLLFFYYYCCVESQGRDDFRSSTKPAEVVQREDETGFAHTMDRARMWSSAIFRLGFILLLFLESFSFLVGWVENEAQEIGFVAREFIDSSSLVAGTEQEISPRKYQRPRRILTTRCCCLLAGVVFAFYFHVLWISDESDFPLAFRWALCRVSGIICVLAAE